MKTVKIFRNSDQAPMLESVWITGNWWQRARGLLGRPRLAESEGMLIQPCSSVHTWGMTYSIDLVYISAEGMVKKCIACLKPWKMSMAPGTQSVLELASGTVSRLGIKTGDVLTWE